LRILVVISRPLAQLVPVEHGGQQFEAVSPVPLEPVEAVRDGLRRVFLDDETPARVRYLPWARLGDLQAALAEPYDVVDFVGHGAEDGRLLLEADDGAADLVSPQRLAEAMREAGVRLALLSACHSGAVGGALHKAGIPNVVMVDERYPMAAGAAALFNRQFYTRLARGRCLLEAFEAGVRAVRTDRDFGDEAPPPRNEYGEIEPRYGERFERIIADDRPLVEGIPTAGYEELYPSKARCTATRDEVFVGREAKMIEVIRQMQTARLVALTGPGGIGKTALVRQVAWWHAERRLFRNGVIEVNLENVRDEGELVSQLAYALDVELDPRHPWDTIRGALSGRWLVLLDSAEGLTPEAIEYLGEPLLGRLEELHLLVTSHAPLHLVKYEQPIEVEQLVVGRGEWIGPAERMFIAYTPQKRQLEAVSKHFEAVRTICVELDGYPLGILLEAAQLSDERETPERLLDALRANMVEALRYSRAAGLPDRHKSVGAAMKSSYDKLREAAKQLLAHIAVFPGGASEETLVALEGLDEAQWKGAEQEVRDVGLVRWVEGRYRMLPPIRAWAQTTLPADELKAYCLRAARWLAEQAGMWNAMLRPSEERRAYVTEVADETGQKLEDLETSLALSALASFDRERENLLAAVEWAYDAQEWPLVGQVAENQHEWQDIRALWVERERNDLLAVEAARQEDNKRQQGIALGNLGSVYLKEGGWEQAIGSFEKALAVFRELGNRRGEGATLTNLGSVYLQQGRWEEAIGCHERALPVFRELGDRRGEGATLTNLGVVYLEQGRWEEAIGCFEKDLAICGELGDRHGEAQTLIGLGNVYADLGRWEEAIECYEEDLAIFPELGDRRGEGQTLMGLGNVYVDLGRWEEAIGCYERALRVFRELGDRHGEGQMLGNLGNVYLQEGRWDEAIECYEKSLGIFRELGDRHGEGQTFTNLGIVYTQQGRWDEAIECYQKSLEVFQALGDRQGAAFTLGALGELEAERGNFSEASDICTQSLATFEEIGDPVSIAKCHRRMGYFALELGNLEASLNHFDTALQLALGIHPRPVVETLDDIVHTAKRLGEEGRWEEVAALGDRLYRRVVEIEKEEWRSGELKAVAMLVRRVCAVIGLVGKSRLDEVPEEERAEARETVLEMVKEVDEATGGVRGLEEWVQETTTD